MKLIAMKAPRIQSILYANAVFSLLSSLLILVFSAPVAQYLINLPQGLFMALGAGLLLFALAVLYCARQAAPSRAAVLAIFLADLAWIVLTPIVLWALQDRITRLGNLVLVDIALVVAVFAALEWQALARLDKVRH